MATNQMWNWMTTRLGAGGGNASSVFVVGLGRFGTALASALVDLGVEVVAVDTNPDLVNTWVDRITHVRLADGTNPATLEQLGAAGFDAVVVAIGSDIEASILSTAALADQGAQNIWAKAITPQHGRILERVGATEVVYPEQQMGQRVARVVTGQVLDYFMIDEGFVIAELDCPTQLAGRSLAESAVRQRFEITVASVKPAGGVFTYATADTVVNAGDQLLVAGKIDKVEQFTRTMSASKQ